MQKIRLSHCEMAYGIWGKGQEVLAIQTGLNSCSAEWWHIAKDLGNHFKVLAFDRAGYGESSPSSEPRTPAIISAELLELLDKLEIKTPVTLLGHSQGGLYCVDFACRYPGRVRAMMLLDPLTPFDSEFKEILSADELKRSGIDKLPSLKLAKLITSLGLGTLFKGLLKKSPPFYYHSFTDEESAYLLGSLTRRRNYDTAIQEYLLAERPENNELIRRCIRKNAMDMPVRIITHSSDVFKEEMARYSSLKSETVQRVEEKWQEIMARYTGLSPAAKPMTAPGSGHYIHLTDYPLVKETLLNKL